MVIQPPHSLFSQLFRTVKLGAIDAAKRTIRGVSLISAGAAKGHTDEDGKQVMVDGTTLRQVFDKCVEAGTLKVKLDHGSGVSCTVGWLERFALTATQVLGDLHIYDSEESAPRIFEIAEKNPTHIGISLEFSGEDEAGDSVSLARCDEVITAALVSDPAANVSLYSEKTKLQNTMPRNKKLETAPEEKPTPAIALEDAGAEKEPTLGELAAMFKTHLADFAAFKSAYAVDSVLAPDTENTQGAEGTAPKATDPETMPVAKGENDTKVTTAAAEPDGDEAKLAKAAEMGAAVAVRAFASKFGINLSPAGAPANTAAKPEKTFAQLHAEETKKFDGDADLAMLHCIKNYKKEYAASRLVAPR